jgi:hypothetical protein
MPLSGGVGSGRQRAASVPVASSGLLDSSWRSSFRALRPGRRGRGKCKILRCIGRPQPCEIPALPVGLAHDDDAHALSGRERQRFSKLQSALLVPRVDGSHAGTVAQVVVEPPFVGMDRTFDGVMRPERVARRMSARRGGPRDATAIHAERGAPLGLSCHGSWQEHRHRGSTAASLARQER